MTEKMYDLNSYLKEFTGTVLSCEKTVYNKTECYDLILDRTGFFPEEGGQESDTGCLLTDNDSINVLHVSIKDNVIHHFTDKKAECGSCLKGILNWAERYDKMQQHTGEHMISGFVHKHFGYDNTGFHLGKDNVTLDFNGVFTPEEIVIIEDDVNRKIIEGHKVNISFPSKDQLKEIPYRSKKELEGMIRIVDIEGCDICACCAPHVSNTFELGMIKIVSAEHFRGGTRMSIACGNRALQLFRKKHNDSIEISQILSSKPGEIVEAVKRLNALTVELKQKNNIVSGKYLEKLSETALSNNNPVIFTDDADTVNVRLVVNRMSEAVEGYSACFVGNDNSGYRYIIASLNKDCRLLLEEFKNYNGSRGGGSKSMIQGSCAATEEQIIKIMRRHNG